MSKKCSVKLSSSKKNQIPAAVLCLLMTACFVALILFVAADKSKPNGSIAPPSFSKEGGFYNDAFYLELSSADGYEIFYTVDGSDPDENANRYAQPILIRDATENENVWSMRTDTSAGFFTDEIERVGGEAPGYMPPDFPVDKCTVVRAVCVAKNGSKSPIASHSFFVGFDGKTGYEDLYVLSVATDPDNLFDERDGIYVTGAEYDRYYKTNKHSHYWWWWHANYKLTGKDAERPAHIELFGAKRETLCAQDVGVRIQGRGSRGRLPRSLNFYAATEYGGAARFPDGIFETGYAPDVITAFAGGDAILTKMDDYLVSSLASDRAFAAMHYIPCAMFLDGEYWGVYWITERYDGAYIQYYYETGTDDVMLIKDGAVEEGPDKGLKYYKKMTSFITQTDMTDASAFEMACRLIDMDSYIDYYAAECFIARENDWPESNFALWRTKEKTGGYSDGRWRWMLFDVNSGAFSLDKVREDTVKRLLADDAVFSALMKNRSFERKFYQTLLSLAENNFDPASVRTSMAYYNSVMPQALMKEYERFYGKENTIYKDKTQPLIENIERFLNERYAYITEYCSAHLQTIDNGSRDRSAGSQ